MDFLLLNGLLFQHPASALFPQSPTMLLGRVLIEIDQREYLVHVNVEKRAELVNKNFIIPRIDCNVITRIISDPAA